MGERVKNQFIPSSTFPYRRVFEKMFGFARHLPPSDPPIPPPDSCLCCGKTETDDANLKRCTQCRMARFCNRKCQALAWKGLGIDGESALPDGKHKKHCRDLAARNKPNMLPYQVRVIRSVNGAAIENGEDMPKARPLTKKDKLTKEDVKALKEMSHCARDHYLTLVKDLTEEQRKQKYPMACIERWGGPPENHPLNENYSEYEEDEEEGVPLELLLGDDHGWEHEPVCSGCGSDGDQFFSFCLNRPVNSGFVHHCEFCHKCFYFRGGCLMGCQHCGMGWYTGEDPRELASLAEGISVSQAQRLLDPDGGYDSGRGLKIKYRKEGRGCNVPACADEFTRGLAMEGYWGY